MPRDQFLVAGDAWTQSRKGELNPSKVGASNGDLFGLWFIAGVLVRDAAALNKMEMLQWDVWGAQPQPGQELSAADLDYFDRLATMTIDHILTHGKAGSANGVIKARDGNTYVFSDVYLFSSHAKDAPIKEMTSYVIEVED